MSTESGRGELLAEGPKLHDDLRLVGMAIKKRWEIPPDLKARIIKRLDEITSESPDDEVAIKAINQLRQMELQNQKDEQTAVLQSERNRFLAIAERLGLGKASERIAEVGGGRDSEVVDGVCRERA